MLCVAEHVKGLTDVGFEGQFRYLYLPDNAVQYIVWS